MDKSNVTKLHPADIKNNETFLGSSLSPREIVSELDRFVVGQNKAKKSSCCCSKKQMEKTSIKRRDEK